MHKENNKTIQLSNDTIRYVIITKKDNTWKYISKDYGYKHKYQFTVKINKARTWSDFSSAKLFLNNYHLHIKNYYIVPLISHYSVQFNDYN